MLSRSRASRIAGGGNTPSREMDKGGSVEPPLFVSPPEEEKAKKQHADR